MRRLLLIVCTLGLLGLTPSSSAAQDAPAGEETEGEGAAPETGDAEEGDSSEDDDEIPRLRPPEMEPIDVTGDNDEPAGEEPVAPEGEGEAEAEPEAEPEPDPEPEAPAPTEVEPEPEAAAAPTISPSDAAARLSAEEPDDLEPLPSDTTAWTAPKTSLTLHGYFRGRGEIQDSFHLGRTEIVPGEGIELPFGFWVPRDDGAIPAGGCGDTAEVDNPMVACDRDAIRYANIRLRLEPTLALSEDVKVHMQFDVFDNLVLGSTPDGGLWNPTTSGFERLERTPGVPLDSFANGQLPPESYRNTLSDAIRVRRAWAEVTNRTLGQLRFGRMGSHWGLGLLANDGRGIDSDYQTDVDRVMAITKLAGFYFIAAYDFASEGFVDQTINDPLALSVDVAQEDDVDQYVFAIARRMDEEDQAAALQRGDVVLNAGLYFVYRTQFLSSASARNPFDSNGVADQLTRRDAEAFIPDIWAQLLWGSLRIELEASAILGSIENTGNGSFALEDYGISMFGAALEMEYKLLDDKLGLYFYTGFASGDSDVDGLTLQSGLQPQMDDDSISTFRFHPNYRIDLILWRNIMRQVAGAYYFKPGISYDFIRNSFGQQLGLRFDVIYSRASAPVQTWGSDPNLGVELNASVYYRSEDGPELFDGFYAQFHYGVLFPMKGLGYIDGLFGDTNPSLTTAQTFRLILGVAY